MNARSVAEKLCDLSNCMAMRSPHIILISETWERPKLGEKIENFCESNRVSWHQKARTGGMGGGVAVLVDNDFGHSAPLDVDVPPELEISWAVVTPHKRKDLRIVCAAFYSSTNDAYRLEVGMLEPHIVEVVSYCTARFNEVSFYIGSDLNSLDTLDQISFKASSNFFICSDVILLLHSVTHLLFLFSGMAKSARMLLWSEAARLESGSGANAGIGPTEITSASVTGLSRKLFPRVGKSTIC